MYRIDRFASRRKDNYAPGWLNLYAKDAPFSTP
jgi:hypothetical protein